MKTIRKINGVTAEVETRPGAPRHLAKFESIEKMVDYMTTNDVIHKGANVNGDMVIISLEKTEQASENWYKNEMRIGKNTANELPTNMYK